MSLNKFKNGSFVKIKNTDHIYSTFYDWFKEFSSYVYYRYYDKYIQTMEKFIESNWGIIEKTHHSYLLKQIFIIRGEYNNIYCIENIRNKDVILIDGEGMSLTEAPIKIKFKYILEETKING